MAAQLRDILLHLGAHHGMAPETQPIPTAGMVDATLFPPSSCRAVAFVGVYGFTQRSKELCCGLTGIADAPL